jgi:hypothetical protein
VAGWLGWQRKEKADIIEKMKFLWTPWGHMESEVKEIGPHILNLCTRRRWLVSFTLRPTSLWGQSMLYLLNTTISGPRTDLDILLKPEHLNPLPGIIISFFSRPAPSLITVRLHVNIWKLELSKDRFLLQIRANVQTPRSLFYLIHILGQ